jgi:hypothetical protein
MLPCSVTASAGIFSSAARSSNSPHAARAVEERELRVQMKVDEVVHWIARGAPPPTRSARGPTPARARRRS